MDTELEAILNRSPVWRRLYETDARYRAEWDAGRGPGRSLDLSGKTPIVTNQTPHWLRYVRLFRSSEDIGVGDTVRRIAAKFGGERFKKFAKRIGLPCGCSGRQAEWNRLFPY